MSDPTPITFEPVDLESLRDELEPQVKGREAGRQGVPPLDAERDPHERPITDLLDRKIQSAQTKLEDALRVADRELGEVLGDPMLEMDAVVQSAESKFEMVATSRRQQLEVQRLESEKRQTDVDRFRREHGLTRREPHYPDRSKRFLMVGIVLILGVIESIANSAFLAKGNELGLIGALVVALGISALNILSAF